jgi:CheY-like chemotaxis protein
MSAATPLNVFLVEDNEDTRLVLAQLLEATGCEVHVAGSMQAALREFPLFSSAVLLSDLGLPDGDGWTLLRALRQDGWSPYAIAMSGFGTLADVAASRAAGFRHHLVKPVEWDALERLLDDVRQEIDGLH